MRKLCFLLILWTFIVPDLIGQEVTARLDYGRRDPHPEFYEYSPIDKGLVTLGPASIVSSRYIALTKYDENLEQEWTEKVLEKNGRKNVDFVTILGQYIYVFVSEYFPKEKVIKSYYYQYSLTGDLLADEELLSVSPNQKEHRVEFQFERSLNKKKLLCYKNLQNDRDAEEIQYYILSDDGDLYNNGQFTLKYSDNKFIVKRVNISNQGNIYILGKHFKVNRVRDPDDYEHLIYRYDTQAEQGNEIDLNLDDRYITDLELKVDKLENIYTAGFYADRNQENISGSILQKISPTGELEISNTTPFTEDFLANYLSPGQISRGKGLRNIDLNHIVLRSDGGVLLLAEKSFATYHSYRDNYGYWSERTLYHYDDIILTSLDQSGQIEWNAIIDKQLVSENYMLSSYFNTISKLGILFFYEFSPKRKLRNIYVNVVDIEGNVGDRQSLLEEFNYGDQFYPQFCEQVSSSEAIMVFINSRSTTLSVIKVSLD